MGKENSNLALKTTFPIPKYYWHTSLEIKYADFQENPKTLSNYKFEWLEDLGL